MKGASGGHRPHEGSYGLWVDGTIVKFVRPVFPKSQALVEFSCAGSPESDQPSTAARTTIYALNQCPSHAFFPAWLSYK